MVKKKLEKLKQCTKNIYLTRKKAVKEEQKDKKKDLSKQKANFKT